MSFRFKKQRSFLVTMEENDSTDSNLGRVGASITHISVLFKYHHLLYFGKEGHIKIKWTYSMESIKFISHPSAIIDPNS